jgi:cytochrome b6-f complex iron-sulfur subunit
LLFAVLGLVVTAQQRAPTGHVSRETRRRDRDAAPSLTPAPARVDRTSEHVSEEARARADEARRAIERSAAVPATTGERAPVRYEPVDVEELGVTRRQFFNRSILAGLGLSIGAFGVASLGFLWPSGGGGFGGKIQVGSVADVQAAFGNKQPYYNAAAKAYMTPYPKADVVKAKKVSAYTAPIIAGMELG